MHSIATVSSVPVPGKVTNTFSCKHTHTRCGGKQPSALAPDSSTLSALAQTNSTPTQTHGKGTAGTSSCTSHVDIDVGSLPRALLQADVAAHVCGLSPGDVQRGHPIHLLLSPNLGPLLPLPLHRLHTPALQLEGCAERHDHVGTGGGDNGLGVACNGIETKIDVFETWWAAKDLVSYLMYSDKTTIMK